LKTAKIKAQTLRGTKRDASLKTANFLVITAKIKSTRG
jgi:hypothetical protein